MRAAESMASAIWSWMPTSKESVGSLRPAVSMSRKRSSMRAVTLSRVVPSSRATMARFLRAKRLSRLDLPALVWPIKATMGRDFMDYIIMFGELFVKNSCAADSASVY